MKPLAVAALLLLAWLSMGTRGCTTDVKNTSDSGSKKQATLGEPITLSGPNDEKLTVSPTQVVELSGSYVAEGKYLVGVQVNLRNASSKPFSSFAVNTDAKILTNTNAQADAKFVDAAGCTGFGTNTVIASGADRSGCISFEVIRGQRPKTFQWVMNSFSGDTGEWTLP